MLNMLYVHIQIVGIKACALLVPLNRTGSYLLVLDAMPWPAQHQHNTTAEPKKWCSWKITCHLLHFTWPPLHCTVTLTAKQQKWLTPASCSRKWFQKLMPLSLQSWFWSVSVHGLSHCLSWQNKWQANFSCLATITPAEQLPPGCVGWQLPFQKQVKKSGVNQSGPWFGLLLATCLCNSFSLWLWFCSRFSCNSCLATTLGLGLCWRPSTLSPRSNTSSPALALALATIVLQNFGQGMTSKFQKFKMTFGTSD